MKLLIVLLPLIFLIGCQRPNEVKSEIKKVEIKVVIEKPAEVLALDYLGFDEKIHRKELKNLIGVDPVHTEWCAAFVNAILEEAGIPGSDVVSEHPLTAKSFLLWGTAVEEPEMGDIVVFPRGDESWQGHVGFYLRTQVINGRKYYYILGGNQNNKVSIKLYRAKTVLGIRRYAF